ncbi:MAG TPA: methyltransferase domain-containing protein [Bauldia sp.]|nr:methyltransferase domain-containing protein [Bauldia sp.]
MSVADRFRFLVSLWNRPKMTGAVAPSSAALCALMASYVDPNDPLPILELGPGTGVVTRALIERGVPPDRIVAIEYAPEFVALIRERFPGVRVVQGDAFDLDASLPPGFDRFAAIVSSLPLPQRSEEERQRLVMSGLSRMAKGRPFIQFSYLKNGPVPVLTGGFTAEASHWIWGNIPPARVWRYRAV